MKTTMLFLATATAALVACGDNAVTGTDAPEFSRESPAASARGLVVMTRNVYLGVELGPVMTAPAEQIPVAAAGVWSNLQYTNFPERAGRLGRVAIIMGTLVNGAATLRYAVWQHGAAADLLSRERPNWVVEDLIGRLGTAR